MLALSSRCRLVPDPPVAPGRAAGAGARHAKRRFVGTNAWFFLIVNATKVPFSVGLGLMHWSDAGRALALAPAVLLGGLLGYATIKRISQARFDVAVLAASAVAAAALLVR